jgi:hypothetical protein
MPGNPANFFGKQVRRERLARGWSLDELSERSGIAASHLSRIENGKRPPTGKIADGCDAAFPERKGWFREYFDESQHWLPPALRSWTEHEDKAKRLYVWSPGVVHGVFQTEAYGRAMMATLPGVTEDVLSQRLAARTARQRRVLLREDPPEVTSVVDHVSLYRLVGSAEVMADQCARLASIASVPNVSMHVMPAVAHPGTASELVIADDVAAYAEHLAGGGVYTEEPTVSHLSRVFAALRGESYRLSESLAIIRKAEQLWRQQATGGNPASAAPREAV